MISIKVDKDVEPFFKKDGIDVIIEIKYTPVRTALLKRRNDRMIGSNIGERVRGHRALRNIIHYDIDNGETSVRRDRESLICTGIHRHRTRWTNSTRARCTRCDSVVHGL